MLTASFVHAKGISEDLEKALWNKGIGSWDLAREHADDVAEIIGTQRAGKLQEAIRAADTARAKGDAAWFAANWPVEHSWRLWQGFCSAEHIGLLDIETTGLTAGIDQVTVAGLVCADRQRAFVAGTPQEGHEPLERFPETIRSLKLISTFNGMHFDVPFLEKHFRSVNLRFDLPHIDWMPAARSVGLSGGLKDMEKALGLTRSDDIKAVRGNLAIHLWAQWRSNGDREAYRTLTAYCLTDCANLKPFGDAIYQKLWARSFTAHYRPVDFRAIKGQQQSIF